ncbi:MAG: VWA domain-containing protein [Caulobacterales bacterium]|nr:VWA domain-containing protein [Caulobacterales bacterium]
MQWLKVSLVSVLSLATATSGAIAQSRTPAPVGPTNALDGEATPAACEQFGYHPRSPQAGPPGQPYVRRGPMTGVVGPTPPPPPPPPPPAYSPSVQSGTADQIAVTGNRARRPDVFTAPVPGQPGDTERYPDAPTNGVVVTAENSVSTLAIDVDTASYANVRRFLNEGSLPPRDAVRVEELVNYFDYEYARPQSRTEPFSVFTEVTPSPWAEGRQIVHVGLQGYELDRAERPPLNLVFLIDVSGSMSAADKLPLAQQALNTLIDQLRPQDRVGIVVYAGAAGAVLQPTPGDQRLRMRCAVNALHAGGSTAGGQGLALAYQMAEANFDRDRVNRVVLVTDGDFNVGVTSDQRLEDFVAERRESGVYLSVYGFGRGNYNDSLMQAIAQAGNGTAGYVDSLNEANRLFRDDFSGSIFPIADDVKVQIEFNPAQVAEWRLIGYETRLLNREDFNNDEVDAGDAGSGATVTALYEVTPVGGPTQVDPLRYAVPSSGSRDGELAFVRVRYKMPGEDDSHLMEQVVGAGAVPPSQSTRWALAVAAFGQRLRGDPWMSSDFDWGDIQTLAMGAVGRDPDGSRREFIGLVNRASELERRTP